MGSRFFRIVVVALLLVLVALCFAKVQHPTDYALMVVAVIAVWVINSLINLPFRGERLGTGLTSGWVFSPICAKQGCLNRIQKECEIAEGLGWVRGSLATMPRLPELPQR